MCDAWLATIQTPDLSFALSIQIALVHSSTNLHPLRFTPEKTHYVLRRDGALTRCVSRKILAFCLPCYPISYPQLRIFASFDSEMSMTCLGIYLYSSLANIKLLSRIVKYSVCVMADYREIELPLLFEFRKFFWYFANIVCNNMARMFNDGPLFERLNIEFKNSYCVVSLRSHFLGGIFKSLYLGI